jgi:hypothetical protein
MEKMPRMAVTIKMLAKAAMTLLRMDKFSNQRIFSFPVAEGRRKN